MKAWFSILLCALLLRLPGQSHAGEGHRLCDVPELSAEEAARIDVGDRKPVLTALDFHTDPGHSYDPSDFDFRIWLGWNRGSGRIYAALAAADDDYVNEYSRPENDDVPESRRNLMGVWDGAVEIAIDGDHSGGAWHLSEGIFRL